MQQFSWILLLGGLAFFFFGLMHARTGLQLLAGDRLRLAITRLTGNRVLALGFGTLMTVVLQSSTATSVMLVTFAASGLLTLTQAFGVILGADIGTTFVVILLSIKKITDYSLLMIALGFLVEWIFRENKLKFGGTVLLGFGLIFFGMQLMIGAATPFSDNPEALQIFVFLANHPIATFLAATVFTGIGQASAATIGITIALAHSGTISLDSALPMVLGANVGTTSAALVAGLGSNANGFRVALAHLFVKLIGSFLILPFIPQAVWLMNKISAQITTYLSFIEPGVSGEIALFHLLFNVFLVLLFLPFLSWGVWAISKLVPEEKKEREFGAKYLQKQALETPALAFAQAKRELLRLAGLAQNIYRDSIGLFQPSPNFDKLVANIETQDDHIDLLERDIRFYLAKISQKSLTEGQAKQQLSLLAIANDFESLGDVVSKELVVLGKKKMDKQKTFSKEGWEDIKKMYQIILDNFDLMTAALTAPNEEIVQRVIRQGEHIKELETELRQSHIQRLHHGLPETFETSSIHLEVLGHLRRVSGHLMHAAHEALLVG